MSKSTSRSVSIREQLDQTFFPDGNASDFLDVVPFHHATTWQHTRRRGYSRSITSITTSR
jgi:hypothetical protein